MFEVKAMVMKNIPRFMNGVFRGAMKISLHEITKKRANNVHVGSRWERFGRKVCQAKRQRCQKDTLERMVARAKGLP